MLEVQFQKFPAVFASVKGRNGVVREFLALIDPCSEYCVIPKVDAFALGYPEAANDDPITPADNTLTYTSHDGYGKAALITMAEVAVGGKSYPAVEFVALDLPQATRFDVVMGRSFLRNTQLEIDYSSGRLRLDEAKEVTRS